MKATGMTTDANGTVAIGYQAGTAITEGQRNVLMGYQAGLSMTTMDDTVAIGYGAGDALTTVTGRNTIIGSGAGSDLTTESQNVAIGSSALGGATGVSNVIAIGHRAAVALSHGDSSGTFAIGVLALEAANGAHARNLAIGYYAGNAITTGGSTCTPTTVNGFFNQFPESQLILKTVGTDDQEICNNSPITDIFYKILGTNGASVSALVNFDGFYSLLRLDS